MPWVWQRGTLGIEDLLAAGVISLDQPADEVDLAAIHESVLQQLLSSSQTVISADGTVLVTNNDSTNDDRGDEDVVDFAFSPASNPRGQINTQADDGVDSAEPAFSRITGSAFSPSNSPLIAPNNAVSADDVAAQLIREQAANESPTTPTLPDAAVVSAAPITTETADEVAPNFARGEAAVLLEDRDVYLSLDKLLANDGEGTVLAGIEGIDGTGFMGESVNR